MPFVLLGVAIAAIAIVLGIFTGVWGGLIWLLVAGGAFLAGLLVMGSRGAPVNPSTPEPQGRPRTGPPAPGTANRRVEQG